MEGLKKQELIIKSRESFNCDAVRDVEEFSGEYVIINTEYGKLNVEGEDLRIKELCEKEGKITVTGKISGVFFRDESEGIKLFRRKK